MVVNSSAPETAWLMADAHFRSFAIFIFWVQLHLTGLWFVNNAIAHEDTTLELLPIKFCSGLNNQISLCSMIENFILGCKTDFSVK